MTRTKIFALFVAVAGSLLYLYNVVSPPETWESNNKKGVSSFNESHYIEAEKYFAQALEQAENFPSNDSRLYFSLSQLAEIYKVQSKFSEAEKMLKRIVKIDEKNFGPGHPNVALALNNLAANYRERGKFEEAETVLKRALNVLKEALGPEHPLIANLLEHYAHLLHQMNRPAEAQKLEKRYQAIYSRLSMEN